MTKTISALMVVSALAFGSARAQAADAGGSAAPQRGQVLVAGSAVKAVVVGPVAIHAYSGFSGATMYAARAVSGTDADCKAQPLGGTGTVVRADSVVDFHVGAGQIACLATTTTRSIELLWHAQKDATVAPTMLARR